MGIDLSHEPNFDKPKPSDIINAIALQKIEIYKVSDGIRETREETQRNVSVDDNEHVGDAEEVEEAYIRDMEEGDEPIPRGVDEFTTLYNATDEHHAPDHTHTQLSGQRRHVQAPL